MSFFLHDTYGSAGLHPNISQHEIKLEFASDGVESKTSYFGPKRSINEKIPGFTMVYSIRKTDDPVETFAATGLEDKPVGRVTNEGLPTPDGDKMSDEDALAWQDAHLCAQGVTGPWTEPLTMDINRSYAVTVNGATDVIVNEDVEPGDTLIWRPITKARMEWKATKGSMLERQNPGAPDIVPLRTEYFRDSVESIARRVVNHLEPNDFNLVRGTGQDKSLQITGLLKRMKNSADAEMRGDLPRGKQRQILSILGFLENALALGDHVKTYQAVAASAATPGAKKEALDLVCSTLGAMAQNTAAQYAEITAHKFARAHKHGKGGFTAFATVNTGSS